MNKLLLSLVPIFPYLVSAAFLVLVVLAVALFRRFSKSREEAEQTRRALELELSFFRRLFQLLPVVGKYFASPPGTVSDNDLTISKPIPAVPDPRKSKETKP